MTGDIAVVNEVSSKNRAHHTIVADSIRPMKYGDFTIVDRAKELIKYNVSAGASAV